MPSKAITNLAHAIVVVVLAAAFALGPPAEALAWGKKKNKKKDEAKAAETDPKKSDKPAEPKKIDPALEKKIKSLIATVEKKATGTIVNNDGSVEVPPDHQPYNPDGSRNQDFKVTHDHEGGTATYRANLDKQRELAIKELIGIGPPAVDELSRALTRDYFQYRPMYAYALGEIGDPRAVPALLKYFETGEMKLKNVDFVRSAGNVEMAARLERDGHKMMDDAASALSKITGQSYGRDHKKWSAWWEANKEKVGPVPDLQEYTANPKDSNKEMHFDPSLLGP